LRFCDEAVRLNITHLLRNRFPSMLSFPRHRGLAAITLLSLSLCLLAVLLAPNRPAVAATLTVEATPSIALGRHVLVLEDAGQQLDAEGAATIFRRGGFTPRETQSGDLNFSYTSAAIWIALPLKRAANAPADWLLEVGHPSLDRVELYAPQESGGFLRQIAGDLQPFASRPFAHRNLVFPLSLPAGQEALVLARVTSEGSVTVPLTLWQRDALHHHDQMVYALLCLYYGMLVALFLYNLMLYFAVRDKLYLVYVAAVLCMGIGQASLNGLGNQFLWPDSPRWGHMALAAGMSATGFFGALFVRLFLETDRNMPRIDKALLACMVSFAIAIIAVIGFNYRVGGMLTSITGMVFSFIAVGIGLWSHKQRHPGARYFLLAWTVLLIGVGMLGMRNLGWLPTNLFTQYAMQAGSSLDLLLLSFALADRINTMRTAHEKTSAELLDSKQALVSALTKSEAELEEKVSERTRDLQTANARLLEKEQQLEYMARHDALTGLANRSLLAIRMEHTLARARRSGRSAGILLVDVDDFKLINDSHGHLVGDHLLVKLAGRFQEAVRMTDTVARYGGDEFVIILEEMASQDDAVQVASKLVQAASDVVRLPSGAELRATISVGIAYFPADGETADKLLSAADHAMFAAKAAGRNRWLAAAPA